MSFDRLEQPKKILDQLRDVFRLKHYSCRTEQSYVDWVYRFIVFHNKRHPKDMGACEIEAFLSYLAVQVKIAVSTQNQALSALVFLYRHVLRQDIGGQVEAVRAKQSRYLPMVLTHEEAIAVLSKLSGTHQFVAQILYGSGLRLSEALSLRVKDIDFAQSQFFVRDRKDGNSRITMLPLSLGDRPSHFSPIAPKNWTSACFWSDRPNQHPQYQRWMLSATLG